MATTTVKAVVKVPMRQFFAVAIYKILLMKNYTRATGRIQAVHDIV